MPFRILSGNHNYLQRGELNLSCLKDKWGQEIESGSIKIRSLKLLNKSGEEKDVLVTNEPANAVISFSKFMGYVKNYYLWVGLYRDDGVYCQGITQLANHSTIFKIFFPTLPLLPGGYRISMGVWDSKENKFIMCHHGIYPFRMVFNRDDHGTVYLEHKWSWKLP
jgi:hypothetical protein